MFYLELSKYFRRKYEKIIRNNKFLEEKINKVLVQLEKDPGYASLRTHRVKLSTYGSVYSSVVTKDIRVIWDFRNNNLVILLLDIGGHSGAKGVYK